jgi:hypothetical protein
LDSNRWAGRTSTKGGGFGSPFVAFVRNIITDGRPFTSFIARKFFLCDESRGTSRYLEPLKKGRRCAMTKAK